MRRVFIIGPGNVGKTTVGAVLAAKLAVPFIDLDQQFMERVGHIGCYIDTNGYAAYRQRNAALLAELLDEVRERTVFALSSGFLAYQTSADEVAADADLIARHGVSILLLPSRSAAECVDLIVARAQSRPYLTVDPLREREKFLQRFAQYQGQVSDIQVYSTAAPDVIADQMMLYLRHAE